MVFDYKNEMGRFEGLVGFAFCALGVLGVILGVIDGIATGKFFLKDAAIVLMMLGVLLLVFRYGIWRRNQYRNEKVVLEDRLWKQWDSDGKLVCEMPASEIRSKKFYVFKSPHGVTVVRGSGKQFTYTPRITDLGRLHHEIEAAIKANSLNSAQ